MSVSEHPPRLLLRADAGPRIGVGHVMRCWALAQAWQEIGGVAEFACAELPARLADRLRAEGCEVTSLAVAPGTPADGARLAAHIAASRPAVVVLDGYSFGTEMQGLVRRASRRLLVIDDDGRHGAYDADFLLNQNPHAREELYPARGTGMRLLLGPRYLLLRREFRESSTPSTRPATSPARVLVTMGGADPNDVTSRVCDALLAVPVGAWSPRAWSLGVVIGAAARTSAALQRLRETSDSTIEWIEQPERMSDVLRGADLVITAGGTTIYECAALEAPFVAISIAENQTPTLEYLAQRQACVHLAADEGAFSSLPRLVEELLADPRRRREMAHNAAAEIDPHGAARVVAALRDAEPDGPREASCSALQANSP
jgi:UDP-2,4-diacetamido-2,4,6-trideoxy-beta-L-altropyranose hydrolase